MEITVPKVIQAAPLQVTRSGLQSVAVMLQDVKRDINMRASKKNSLKQILLEKKKQLQKFTHCTTEHIGLCGTLEGSVKSKQKQLLALRNEMSSLEDISRSFLQENHEELTVLVGEIKTGVALYETELESAKNMRYQQLSEQVSNINHVLLPKMETTIIEKRSKLNESIQQYNETIDNKKELQEQLKCIQQEKSSVEQVIKDMNDTIHLSESHIDQLNHSITTKNKNLEQITNAMHETMQLHDNAINRENASIMEQINMIARISEQCQALEEQQQKQQIECQECLDKIRCKSTKIIQFKSQLKQFQQEETQLEIECQHNRERIQHSIQELDALEIEFKPLTEQVKVVTDAIEDKQNKIKHCELELNALVHSLEVLNDEQQQLKSSETQLTEQYASKHAQVEKQLNTMKHLLQSAATIADDMNILGNEYESLKAQQADISNVIQKARIQAIQTDIHYQGFKSQTGQLLDRQHTLLHNKQKLDETQKIHASTKMKLKQAQDIEHSKKAIKGNYTPNEKDNQEIEDAATKAINEMQEEFELAYNPQIDELKAKLYKIHSHTGSFSHVQEGYDIQLQALRNRIEEAKANQPPPQQQPKPVSPSISVDVVENKAKPQINTLCRSTEKRNMVAHSGNRHFHQQQRVTSAPSGANSISESAKNLQHEFAAEISSCNSNSESGGDSECEEVSLESVCLVDETISKCSPSSTGNNTSTSSDGEFLLGYSSKHMNECANSMTHNSIPIRSATHSRYGGSSMLLDTCSSNNRRLPALSSARNIKLVPSAVNPVNSTKKIGSLATKMRTTSYSNSHSYTQRQSQLPRSKASKSRVSESSGNWFFEDSTTL